MKPKALVEIFRENQNNNGTLKSLFATQFLGKLSETELSGLKKSIEKEITSRQQSFVDEKIAYLFSAGAQQTSTFTDDNTQARFTSDLASALNNAASGTSLADIFSAVRETTHRGALSKCNKLGKDTLKSVMGSVDYYFKNCLQAPNYFDPKGLMLDLKKL